MYQSSSYHNAYDHAVAEGQRLRRPMGLEKAYEYGRVVYRVKMIPVDPRKRFGWETRCEIVEFDSHGR